MSPSCTDAPQVTHDSIPIGAIPLLATSNPDYQEAVSKTITSANAVYHEFLKSEEGHGFNGQVSLVADSMGSILAYDGLCRNIRYQSRHGSENSILDAGESSSGHHHHHKGNSLMVVFFGLFRICG